MPLRQRGGCPVTLAVGLQFFNKTSFDSGQFVTAIRERIRDGDRIAVTTNRGLSVPRNGATLQIFDTSFRLIVPTGSLDAADQQGGCGGAAVQSDAAPVAIGLLAAVILRRRRRRCSIALQHY